MHYMLVTVWYSLSEASLSSFRPVFFAESKKERRQQPTDSRWLRILNGFVKVKASHYGENIRRSANERTLLPASAVVDSRRRLPDEGSCQRISSRSDGEHRGGEES